MGLHNIFVGFYINTKANQMAVATEKRLTLIAMGEEIASSRTIPIGTVRTYTYRAAWAVQSSARSIPVGRLQAISSSCFRVCCYCP